MSTFNEEGFLSDEIVNVIRAFRTRDPDLHKSVRSLNQLAQKLICEANVKNDELQPMLCAQFFLRILTLYQAVYIVTCRGMRAERDSLLRAYTEAHLKLHYCAKSFEHARNFILASDSDRLRLLRNWQQLPSQATAEQKKTVFDLISNLERKRDAKEIPRLTVDEIAKETGREMEYRGPYALFSQTLHSNPRDFHDHMQIDEENNVTALLWGPNHEGAEFRLVTSMRILLEATSVVPFPNLSPESEGYKTAHNEVERFVIKYGTV